MHYHDYDCFLVFIRHLYFFFCKLVCSYSSPFLYTCLFMIGLLSKFKAFNIKDIDFLTATLVKYPPT